MAAEGFFGCSSPKPEPIWTKFEILSKDDSGVSQKIGGGNLESKQILIHSNLSSTYYDSAS